MLIAEQAATEFCRARREKKKLERNGEREIRVTMIEIRGRNIIKQRKEAYRIASEIDAYDGKIYPRPAGY